MVHATPDWSRAHLNTPGERVAEAQVSTAKRLTAVALDPVELQSHCWLYAQVEHAVGEPCLWDPESSVGVCGDGLLGGRIEYALLSGLALADRMAKVSAS